MMQNENDDKLYFYVKGSATKPYKVTFEGSGENLCSFCTCPAGKMAGNFCKHVAMLLKGDDSALMDSPSTITELQIRAQNSPLVEKAKTHKPSPPKPHQINLGNIKSLSDLATHATEKLTQKDYWCEHYHGDNQYESVSIFMQKYYKNGNPYKKPTLLARIEFDPFTRDTYYDYDTENWVESELRPKVKPYIVDGVSYGRFESAALKFLTKLADFNTEKI